MTHSRKSHVILPSLSRGGDRGPERRRELWRERWLRGAQPHAWAGSKEHWLVHTSRLNPCSLLDSQAHPRPGPCLRQRSRDRAWLNPSTAPAFHLDTRRSVKVGVQPSLAPSQCRPAPPTQLLLRLREDREEGVGPTSPGSHVGGVHGGLPALPTPSGQMVVSRGGLALPSAEALSNLRHREDEVNISRGLQGPHAPCLN